MCYKVTVDNIWEVKVISNFWRFSQTENHWILSAFHLENCIWDTGHCEVERVFWEEMLLYECLDVKKILCMWPSHTFMKLTIFAVRWPCPSTGMQSHMQGCGRVWSGIIRFYPVLYCHSVTNILFVCDTNTSYVITYTTENIQTKPHQCLFSNLLKLWCVM